MRISFYIFLGLALVVIATPDEVFAVRTWSSGCELQRASPGNMTDNLEFDASGSAVSTARISTSVGTARSGQASCRAVTSSGQYSSFRAQFADSAGQPGPVYFRFYLNIASAPSSNADIFYVADGSDLEGFLILNSNRTLSWANDDASVVGTSVSALAPNTWQRIEVMYDADDAVTVRVNGSNVISIGSHTGDQIHIVGYGICAGSGGSPRVCSGASGDLYFDDMAVNTSTVAPQNSWPGDFTKRFAKRKVFSCFIWLKGRKQAAGKKRC